eukprot:Opistho-2@28780
MILNADDIVLRHRGDEGSAMAAGRGDIDRVGEMIAVKIICLARGDHRMREAGHDVVPAHVRDAQARRRIERTHGAADPSEPRVATMLFARVGQQLHADADAEEGRTLAAHALFHRAHQPVDRRQSVHARGKRPDAGQHDAVGLRDKIRIGGDGNIVGARRDERIMHRAKIARAIVDQGNAAHFPALEDTLGRRDRIALARIDFDRLPQSARECFVHALGDVMVILAVEHLDVQRDPRRLREAVEPVREHLGVHLAEPRLREGRFIDAVRAPRNVEHAARQRLVHRRMRLAVARDAALVAERFCHRFAERERRILDGVVLVDMKVALHLHRDVDQRMARQLLDHMVEETDAGGHRIFARSVKIDGDRDIRFLGRALDGGGTHGAPIAPTFHSARRLSPLDPRAARVHPLAP